MTVSDADMLRQAAEWRAAGRGVAIATVVETWGSAPRPVGAHLVVDEAGLFLGSVSGGCVEGEVIAAALDAIEDGAPRLLEFGVADETAWRGGLSCGGRIAVHVEKLGAARLDLLHAVNAELAARRACALVTALDGSDAWLCRSGDAEDRLSGEALDLLRSGKSGSVAPAGRRFFINAYTPPPRLVLVGAVHIAQALAPMATRVGFDVVVVDPRSAFAAGERFPGARLFVDWPDAALADLGLDAFTAVAALTHDPRIDDAALRLALDSACFYVGALGSRKTHARRLERLAAAGLDDEGLSRIRAPIGLAIGAATPAEIAVAILAEIIAARRGGAQAPASRSEGAQR